MKAVAKKAWPIIGTFVALVVLECVDQVLREYQANNLPEGAIGRDPEGRPMFRNRKENPVANDCDAVSCERLGDGLFKVHRYVTV